MLKFVSSIGDAAYKTAAKTGLAAGSEQPPYPCALPLQVIEDRDDIDTIERVLNETYASVQDLLSDDMPLLNQSLRESKRGKEWRLVDFTDREGDLSLSTRPHVGPYNFARATMSLKGITPSNILGAMHAQSLKERSRYSNNLCRYEVLLRNPSVPSRFLGCDNDHLEEIATLGVRNWHIEYNRYAAPPPVAPRDFIYLIEKRYVPEQQSYYIYGTSVDYRSDEDCDSMDGGKCVRGAVLFGWRFKLVGNATHCSYISCMNPNGWAPTFIVGWMKTEIAKEFQNSRRLLYSDIPMQLQYDKPDYHGAAIRTTQNNSCRFAAYTMATEDRRMDSEDDRLLEEEEPIVFE